jgi:hypothetical protein
MFCPLSTRLAYSAGILLDRFLLLPQSNQQPKTTKNNFCWCGIIIGKKKPPHHTTTTPPQCDYNSGSSRQHRKLNFGIQSYSNPTRRNIEDNLNIFENGRRPQLFF